VDRRNGENPARRADDRLATAACLAIACHLLLLLGVGFRSPRPTSTDPSTLEVVLVHDPLADTRSNEEADYLAEVNQKGSGTKPDAQSAQSAGGPPPVGFDGEASGGGNHTSGSGEDDLVATRQEGPHASTTLAVAAGARSPLILEPSQSENWSLDTGDAFALRGRPTKELVVTANTKASGVAVYLDAWRHRIERIGTANYPLEVVRRARLSGSPVVEVRVASDGRLVDAVVIRSSGHVALDQAALNILKMAAPFEPFPEDLAAAHDSLKLSYEWQFTDGVWRDSAVRAPQTSR
jgi:periplasmic protein TonB